MCVGVCVCVQKSVLIAKTTTTATPHNSYSPLLETPFTAQVHQRWLRYLPAVCFICVLYVCVYVCVCVCVKLTNDDDPPPLGNDNKLVSC